MITSDNAYADDFIFKTKLNRDHPNRPKRAWVNNLMKWLDRKYPNVTISVGGIKRCYATGFVVSFPNNWSISVIYGDGTYSSIEFETVEVAVILNGKMQRWPDRDTVGKYISVHQLFLLCDDLYMRSDTGCWEPPEGFYNV